MAQAWPLSFAVTALDPVKRLWQGYSNSSISPQQPDKRGVEAEALLWMLSLRIYGFKIFKEKNEWIQCLNWSGCRPAHRLGPHDNSGRRLRLHVPHRGAPLRVLISKGALFHQLYVFVLKMGYTMVYHGIPPNKKCVCSSFSPTIPGYTPK